jgi:hypothetical protein
MNVLLNPGQEKLARKLDPVLDRIQVLMKEKIKTEEDKLSGPEVYQALGPVEGLNLTQQEFQACLSLAVRGGLVQGFEGRRGRNGGYVLAGSVVHSADSDSEQDEESTTSQKGFRLGQYNVYQKDPLNWTVEGSGHKRYYPTLVLALKSVSRFLVEAEIASQAEQAQDLIGLFATAEERVFNKLTEVVVE